MLKFVCQADFVVRTLEVFAEKGRKVLHQLTGPVPVTTDHRHQRIQGVEQEMRIDLRMQQFDFRLRQQLRVALILAGHDLCG
ncbi:hypothetical protein D3C76_1495680 [compost metagenome]